MRRLLILTAVGAGVVAGAAAVLLQPADPPARSLPGLEGDVARGAYVARLSGCIACHTDAAGGGAPLAGGVRIETEFGVFVSPNITPHPEDGIGAWSQADFARALTAGLSPEGHRYYPSFPWPFYARMTDQDVVDLWAAVNSVPAVAGEAETHDLAFPFDQRALLGPWTALNGPKFAWEKPKPDDPLARGRYLVEGPAHCGACHTPRNALGGRRTTDALGGAVEAGGGRVPSIRAEDLAASGWTAETLVFALRTGVTPEGDVFGGSMAEVVAEGTRFWTEADLHAAAAYILSLHDDQ
ncbi:MAG: cytochrome c [Pseudomonadota bacterium]